jgi:subtilisin family serine protease
MLTDYEAETLKSDGRVLNVELSPEERDDLELVDFATQEGNFTRKGYTSEDYPDLRNWALRRHSSETNPYTSTSPSEVITSQGENDSYDFNLAGEGVDIVIFDEGLSGSHPDFHDEHGNSRVKHIHWEEVLAATGYDLDFSSSPYYKKMNIPENFYTEHLASHGTCCASVAAGNLSGFAKKAHIYSAKYAKDAPLFSGLRENGTAQPWTWYDRILHWHKNKGNDRPTVVNNSYGYLHAEINRSQITAGMYRGTAWVRGNETDDELTDLYGIDYGIPSVDKYQATYDSITAQIDEMTDAGIHFVIAAGNFKLRVVGQDHPDFDNWFSIAGSETLVYYARKGAPYGKDAIIVGALDSDIDATSGKDKLAQFTNRGAGVDLYAAGYNCVSAASVEYEDSAWAQHEYPLDSNFPAQFFAGTSCASPIVAGVAACYLSARPHLSPKRLKKILIEDAKVGQIEEVAGDYHTTLAFLDGNNRVLFNKYNNSAGATFDGGEYTGSVLGGSFAISTTFEPARKPLIGGGDIRTTGVEGLIAGEIENASFAGINENGTITQIKSKYNQATKRSLITLRVEGRDIENSNWSVMRTSRARNSRYEYVFHRKDAKWTEHLGIWEWDLSGRFYFPETKHHLGFI